MTTVPILAAFATACISALTVAHFIIKKSRPTLPRGEYLTAMWFVLCGCIHSVLEVSQFLPQGGHKPFPCVS